MTRLRSADQSSRGRSAPSALRRRVREDGGSALIEFVVLAVVILVPSLYLVITLGAVQSAVFAADVLARDAARILATEPDPATADARIAELTAQLLDDYGLENGEVVSVDCSSSRCATPGGTVQVQVRMSIAVPGIGPLLGGDGPFAVGSAHQVAVDQYRSTAP